MAMDLTQYIDNRQSFFLYAGAGSGKTYTLVEVLKHIKSTLRTQLELTHKKVAVITYTNAATDEIKRRIGFDELFDISTIHSFVWEMIQPYQEDIKKLLIVHIQDRIDDYEQKQQKMKDKQSKTYIERQAKIDKYSERLGTIQAVKVFKYNPNGDNSDSDSLNHSDVIEIGAELFGRPLLQRIMVQRYPYIMIDESQDTKKEIMLVMLEMAKNYQGSLTMGLFGDVKQRIYLDGVPDIENHISEVWGKPVLSKNHRSASDIVRLTNLIALEMQPENISRQDAVRKDGTGYVRLYIVKQSGDLDKERTEKDISEDMAEETGDVKWKLPLEVKTLILEHRMAAARLGFEDFYETLYNVGRYSEDFLKGQAADMSVFMDVVFPILEAHTKGNKERVLEIVQNNCTLLSGGNFINLSQMKSVSEKVNAIIATCTSNKCTIEEAVKSVVEAGMFKVSPMLLALVKDGIEADFSESQMNALEAWQKAKCFSLVQFYHYFEYVTERSRFATHQGVKGLQFPRVMAIYDDASARGNLFSYEKSFGVAGLSDTEMKNKREGKETSVERTMRLLYVTCSRAMDSLALVVYSSSPDKVREFCLNKKWFNTEEIIMWPRNTERQ